MAATKSSTEAGADVSERKIGREDGERSFNSVQDLPPQRCTSPSPTITTKRRPPPLLLSTSPVLGIWTPSSTTTHVPLSASLSPPSPFEQQQQQIRVPQNRQQHYRRLPRSYRSPPIRSGGEHSTPLPSGTAGTMARSWHPSPVDEERKVTSKSPGKVMSKMSPLRSLSSMPTIPALGMRREGSRQAMVISAPIQSHVSQQPSNIASQLEQGHSITWPQLISTMPEYTAPPKPSLWERRRSWKLSLQQRRTLSTPIITLDRGLCGTETMKKSTSNDSARSASKPHQTEKSEITGDIWDEVSAITKKEPTSMRWKTTFAEGKDDKCSGEGRSQLTSTSPSPSARLSASLPFRRTYSSTALRSKDELDRVHPSRQPLQVGPGLSEIPRIRASQEGLRTAKVITGVGTPLSSGMPSSIYTSSRPQSEAAFRLEQTPPTMTQIDVHLSQCRGKARPINKGAVYSNSMLPSSNVQSSPLQRRSKHESRLRAPSDGVLPSGRSVYPPRSPSSRWSARERQLSSNRPLICDTQELVAGRASLGESHTLGVPSELRPPYLSSVRSSSQRDISIASPYLSALTNTRSRPLAQSTPTSPRHKLRQSDLLSSPDPLKRKEDHDGQRSLSQGLAAPEGEVQALLMSPLEIEEPRRHRLSANIVVAALRKTMRDLQEAIASSPDASEDEVCKKDCKESECLADDERPISTPSSDEYGTVNTEAKAFQSREPEDITQIGSSEINESRFSTEVDSSCMSEAEELPDGRRASSRITASARPGRSKNTKVSLRRVRSQDKQSSTASQLSSDGASDSAVSCSADIEYCLVQSAEKMMITTANRTSRSTSSIVSGARLHTGNSKKSEAVAMTMKDHVESRQQDIKTRAAGLETAPLQPVPPMSLVSEGIDISTEEEGRLQVGIRWRLRGQQSTPPSPLEAAKTTQGTILLAAADIDAIGRAWVREKTNRAVCISPTSMKGEIQSTKELEYMCFFDHLTHQERVKAEQQTLKRLQEEILSSGVKCLPRARSAPTFTSAVGKGMEKPNITCSSRETCSNSGFERKALYLPSRISPGVEAELMLLEGNRRNQLPLKLNMGSISPLRDVFTTPKSRCTIPYRSLLPASQLKYQRSDPGTLVGDDVHKQLQAVDEEGTQPGID